MKSVNITREGIIECYGNRAGYVKDNVAVVDEMFKRDEVSDSLMQENGLSVVWKEGVYDKLVKGEIEESIMIKLCRVHQLNPSVDLRMKFIEYNELIAKGFGEPRLSNYHTVYDGNIGTNNLEEIFSKFNQDQKIEGYSGYSLSMSDMIELYDDDGSEFYYVDRFGFVKLNEQDVRMTNELEEAQAESFERDIDRQTELLKHDKNPIETPVYDAAKVEAEYEAEEYRIDTFKISM